MLGSPPRAFDVAILGATGFTGRLAVEYLTSAYGATADVKWLCAGRSQSRLDSLCSELGIGIDVRVVDCTDSEAMVALAKEVRVIANFAGTPFADKALPVVEACR